MTVPLLYRLALFVPTSQSIRRLVSTAPPLSHTHSLPLFLFLSHTHSRSPRPPAPSLQGLCEGIIAALGSGRIKSITGGGSDEQAAAAGRTDLEAGLYLWGALKNMSVDSSGNQERMLLHGAFAALAAWMRGISRWRRELGSGAGADKAREVSADVLVQAASVFRNLASSIEVRLRSPCHLCPVMEGWASPTNAMWLHGALIRATCLAC